MACHPRLSWQGTQEAAKTRRERYEEDKVNRAVLITSASLGIGKACAERSLGEGDRVYGSGRRPDAGSAADGLQMIALDVNDDESVMVGIERIVQA